MTDSMRAARFRAEDMSLRVEEVALPEPGPLDVLVAVDACGICLSDVHLLDGTIPPVAQVVTPGHESSGRVVAVGELVQGWSEGDRVSIAGGRPCGRCRRCTSGRPEHCRHFELMGFAYDGAWADYVVVPYFTLARLPEGVAPEHAAILADAVATPYGALKGRAALQPGETVGLWGIGGLGFHGVQLSRLLGASLVVAVDPLPAARERALAAGADVAFDPANQDVRKEVMRLTGGDGLDVTLDLVGANAVLKQAVSCLAMGGRAVMVGLSMEPLELEPSLVFGILRHTVMGHLGYTKQDLDELVALLSAGRLDLGPSISDRIGLEEVGDGVRRLAEKEGHPIRIVVTP